MSDIFISYATEDLSRVRPLADGLSGRGLSVWWDRQIQAGRAFDEVIAEALASARCVVVVWSRNSVASSWVREEAEEGRKRGVLPLPEIRMRVGGATARQLHPQQHGARRRIRDGKFLNTEGPERLVQDHAAADGQRINP